MAPQHVTKWRPASIFYILTLDNCKLLLMTSKGFLRREPALLHQVVEELASGHVLQHQVPVQEQTTFSQALS